MNQEERLIKNWSESSAGYSSNIEKELAGLKREAWTKLILENTGKDPQQKLQVLDVGTGPGFFAILMAKAGHAVTAVDCASAMVDCAIKNAKSQGVEIDFGVSDAQRLPFEDASFDLILSRNVTWTLLDAKAAYREWKRVLTPDGRILIFDANWNIRLHDEKKRAEYERDMAAVKEKYPEYVFHDHTPDMEDFRKTLPMCAVYRPQWDFSALLDVGFKRIGCDLSISERIYSPMEQLLYRSTPMFLLTAEK